jgi:hypothetical protein
MKLNWDGDNRAWYLQQRLRPRKGTFPGVPSERASRGCQSQDGKYPNEDQPANQEFAHTIGIQTQAQTQSWQKPGQLRHPPASG